jgi:hypothetical protein
VTPELPLEIVVRGIPVSLQASTRSRRAWRDTIRFAAEGVIPGGSWALTDRLAVTIFYFAEGQMLGDIDNIVKPILDAMIPNVYVDDSLIDRVVVQRFAPSDVFSFTDPTPALTEAIVEDGPAVYIRITDDLHEDLQ